MLPHLTEAWSSVYLQVIAGILIFGVGFPALALQYVVNEDVRVIVHKHYRTWIHWGTGCLVIFSCLMLFFIWILHPAEPEISEIQFSDGVFKVVPIEEGFTNTFRDTSDLLGALIMSGAILALLPFWRVQTRYRRDRVLKRLGQKCEKSIRKHSTPDENVLADIRFLGYHAEVGPETELVLNILDHLARQVQYHAQYDGTKISGIVETVVHVISNKANGKNYEHALTILRNIIAEIRYQTPSSTMDMADALRSLYCIGVIALKQNSLNAGGPIVSAIDLATDGENGAYKEATATLFALGKEAIQFKNFPFAMTMFAKLQFLTHRHPITFNRGISYLGLVACIWAYVPSAREEVRTGLRRGDFRPSLIDCLNEAEMHYSRLSDFETVDNIRLLRRIMQPRAQRLRDELGHIVQKRFFQHLLEPFFM